VKQAVADAGSLEACHHDYSLKSFWVIIDPSQEDGGKGSTAIQELRKGIYHSLN
jgi:hypothetical protein